LTIILGWIVSVALHEFAHAYTAYFFGDWTCREYLDLDIRKYTDPVMTFIVPCLFLILGGIALPGAAVSIETANIAKKIHFTYIAIAGPVSNFIFGCIISLYLQIYTLISPTTVYNFATGPALSCLAYYQIMATVLNFLPLPPLDGWNAISPWIDDSFFLKRWLKNPWRARSIMIISFFIICFFVTAIPGFVLLLKTISNIYNLDKALLKQGLIRFGRLSPFH